MSKETTTTHRVTIQTDDGLREIVLTKTIVDHGNFTVRMRRDVEDRGVYRPPGRAVRRRPGKPTMRVIVGSKGTIP